MSEHATNQPTTPAIALEAIYALVAEFEDVATVTAAAERVRDAGYTQWDVHAPFPIHGIDKAMGMRPTILPWFTLGGGLAGLFGGLLLVWGMNATTIPGVPTSLQGYQYMISGKPTFSLPANIPIIFETTILLAAFGTVLGMFALNRLPMLYNPLFKSRRFRQVTTDRFYIVIEATDPKFHTEATAELLLAAGSKHLERVTD